MRAYLVLSCVHFVRKCHCGFISVQLDEGNAAKEEDAVLRRKAEEGYLMIKDKVNTVSACVVCMYCALLLWRCAHWLYCI